MGSPIPPEQQDWVLNVQSCKLRDHARVSYQFWHYRHTALKLKGKLDRLIKTQVHDSVQTQTAPVNLGSWILLQASKFYILMVILETRETREKLVKSAVSHSRQRH